MGLFLLIAGFGLVALPGATYSSFGRFLPPRSWVQACTTALVTGTIVLELTLLLYASVLLPRTNATSSMVAVCIRMLGTLIPENIISAWIALCLASAVAVLAVFGWVEGRRIRRNAHVDRSLGEHDSFGPDHLVTLPSEEVVCYSVGGRSRQIIISTGLVKSLTELELNMVLAHEAAHIGLKHDRLLAVLGALGRSFWFFPPMRMSAAGLRTAMEQSADEFAASTTEEGRSLLYSALRRVTAQLVGLDVAAFSATDTVAARLGALERPPIRFDLRSMTLFSGLVLMETSTLAVALSLLWICQRQL